MLWIMLNYKLNAGGDGESKKDLQEIFQVNTVYI